jgi:hypothetical protein
MRRRRLLAALAGPGAPAQAAATPLHALAQREAVLAQVDRRAAGPACAFWAATC